MSERMIIRAVLEAAQEKDWESAVAAAHRILPHLLPEEVELLLREGEYREDIPTTGEVFKAFLRLRRLDYEERMRQWALAHRVGGAL